MKKVLLFILMLWAGPVWSQTPILLPNAEQQYNDANGVPYSGGKVYFYVPGTTTPKTTYQDEGLTTPNTNPVTLDSAGRARIWGNGLYRQVLYDQFANLVWDQLTGIDLGTFTNINCTGTCTAPTQPPGTNNTTIATTAFVQNALLGSAVFVNVKGSCGAKGDGVTDDTAAINTCTAQVASGGGGVLFFPTGTYSVCSVSLNMNTNVIWLGSGHNATVIKACSTGSNDIVQTAGFSGLTGTNSPTGPFGWGIQDLKIDGNKAGRGGGNCLSVYGYNFTLFNVDFANCFADGIYSEWSTSATVPVAAGGESMEAHLINVRVFAAGTDGISWNGPHDSTMTNVLTFLNGHYGALFDNSAVHSGGGTMLTNLHSYGNTSTGVEINANIYFSGLESEHNGGVGVDCTGTTFGFLHGSTLSLYNNTAQGLNLHLGCPGTLSSVQSFSNGSTGIQISNGSTLSGVFTYSNTGDGLAISIGDVTVGELRAENNIGNGVTIGDNLGNIVLSGKLSGNLTNQIALGTTLLVNSIISVISFNTAGGQTSYTGSYAANTYVNIQTGGTGALGAVFSHP